MTQRLGGLLMLCSNLGSYFAFSCLPRFSFKADRSRGQWTVTQTVTPMLGTLPTNGSGSSGAGGTMDQSGGSGSTGARQSRQPQTQTRRGAGARQSWQTTATWQSRQSRQRQQSRQRPQSRQAWLSACRLKHPPWHPKRSQEHSHHLKQHLPTMEGDGLS